MVRAYPSLFLLLFIIGGILLANYVDVSPLVGLAFATLAAGLAVAIFMRQRHVGAAFLAGTALGLIAAVNFGLHYRGFGPNHLANIIQEPLLSQVYGRVADWPELKQDRTEIRLDIDSLLPVAPQARVVREVKGGLLLKITDTTTAFQRGDRIAFQARLYPVRSQERGDFGYARRLNLQGIHAQTFLPTIHNIQVDRRPSVGFWPFVDRIRAAICESLRRNLSPTASALARGFLIGETRDIPVDVYGRFRDSGTLHLLAVSGGNVALVLVFFLVLMRPFWLGPEGRALVLLAVILVFAGVSYGDPSVVRASLMAALVVGARLLGRVYDLNNIIAVAAMIILLLQPTDLFDVGFQLSFATAWGLIFFVPRLGRAFGPIQGQRWYRWFGMPIVASLVAQVVSTPLILFYFERVPLVSVAANLVIVPAVSIGVIAVMVLLVADLIWPLLGLMVGGLVDLWLRGVLVALDFFGGGSVPVWKSSLLSNSAWGAAIVVLSYLVMVLTLVAIGRRWARRMLAVSLAAGVNIAVVVAIVAALGKPGGELRIERLPGGVVVLAGEEKSGVADLVVTGLSVKAGSSGETILSGVVRRSGVTRLRRLVVMSADYSALGDILRIARTLAADSVFVRRDLEPSARDIRSRGDSTIYVGPLLAFSGRIEPHEARGFYLTDQTVRLVLGGLQVDVVDRPSHEKIPTESRGLSRVLVIGNRWRPGPDEWIERRRVGYDRIVCADFEQPARSTWPDSELDPDAVPPDYVIDLSRLGTFRLTYDL